MQGTQSLRADSPQTLVARLHTITQSLRASTTTEAFKDFYKFAFRFCVCLGVSRVCTECACTQAFKDFYKFAFRFC
jgi:hypothetical protein